MPNATATFVAKAPPERVRELVSDLDFVASAIPQVRAVEKTGPTTANWTVELQFGLVRRTMHFRGELVASAADSIRFRAEASEATVEGAIGLVPREAGRETEVRLRLEMRGAGPLRFIIDNYLAGRVRADAEAFARVLETRLSAGARAGSTGRP
jgi:carbon monoxide dehydrogenase subunit G